MSLEPPVAGRSAWWVVAGSTIALTMGNGPLMQFTFGIFLFPVMAEFGVQRGTISLALMAGLCATGLALPFVGRLVDRHGVRRTILPAIVLLAAAIASLGLAATIEQFILIYALAGVIAAGQTPLPYARAVTRAFDARRGLALGISMAGVGIGTMLLPQIAQQLVSAVGWRGAYVALAAILLAVALPAAWLFVHESDDDADASPRVADGAPAGVALRTAAFWMMAASFFLVTLTATGVVAHIVPLLSDRNVDATRAALAIGVAGAAMIAGRLVSGWLLDKVAAPRVALLFFVLQLGGISLLLIVADIGSAVAASFFVGLGLGAEVDLIAYMLSRIFGMRAFGMLYGVLFGIFMLASGIGPVVMGSVFQFTGSYDAALVSFCAALLLACLLMVWLDRFFQTGAASQFRNMPG